MAWAPATLLRHLHYQSRPRLDKHEASRSRFIKCGYEPNLRRADEHRAEARLCRAEWELRMLSGVWLFVPSSAADRWLCVRKCHVERAAMAHVVVTILLAWIGLLLSPNRKCQFGRNER
jgi:hypothetical protein